MKKSDSSHLSPQILSKIKSGMIEDYLHQIVGRASTG